MTTLRSGTQVSLRTQRARRQVSREPTNIDTARNVRYLRNARNYRRNTGDSPETLRQKRLWLHKEHVAGRISEKAFRELREHYSKGKNRLPKARNLTDAAKSIKRRLDDLFNQSPEASPSAGVMDVNDDNTGDAREIPSGTAFFSNSPHINNHEAAREPSDAPPHEEAAEIVAAAYIKSEDDIETEKDAQKEDESSSDLFIPASQARIARANPAEDNDAAARQRILDLGLELADADADTGATFDGMEGGGEIWVDEAEADEDIWKRPG